MSSDKKYFHLLLEITPYMCRPYTRSIVISEDVLDWSERNELHHPLGSGNTRILQFRLVDKDRYLKSRNANPAKPEDRYDPPSCRSFLMCERDYTDRQIKQVA